MHNVMAKLAIDWMDLCTKSIKATCPPPKYTKVSDIVNRRKKDHEAIFIIVGTDQFKKDIAKILCKKEDYFL